MARALALALPLVVSGCGRPDAAGAPRSVQVTADRITIAGPRGFCVDPTSTRDDGTSGFVLLGNCAAISGDPRAPQPGMPAVLTAAISAPSGQEGRFGTLAALDAVFRSEEGRALLSRSGDPDDVEILGTLFAGDIFVLHARDRSPGGVGGVAEEYWRAYFEIGPRLVTLSVLALADAEIAEAEARQVLDGFAASVRRANPGPGGARVAAGLPQAEGEARPGLFRGGMFRRIFR